MEDKKSSRKYDSIFRKKLLEKIKLIKNKKVLVDILNIVKKESEDGYSQNKSGIYFNLNVLEDNSVEEINNIVNLFDIDKDIDSVEESLSDKITYKQYSGLDNIEQYDSIGARLSNQEKSILKKFKNINENN
tara:strand:+ start:888 stop:1283 length:396 start_codon:yes stop_codon:yes gene_type:complete